MSDSNRDGTSMPVTNEIFAAADRQGQSLAEYLKHNFSDQRLDRLETSIRTQLDSLNSEISDFMQGIELPQIEKNLESVEETKLDIMQSRLINELHAKQIEFDTMLSSECESFSAPLECPQVA